MSLSGVAKGGKRTMVTFGINSACWLPLRSKCSLTQNEYGICDLVTARLVKRTSRSKEPHTMKKFIHALTLVVLVSSVSAPVLRAERTGCNPHPQAVAAPSAWELITYTVFSCFGL